MIHKIINVILAAFLLFFICTPAVSLKQPISNESATIFNDLKEAKQEIKVMKEDNLGIVRYNDTLILAKDVYGNQLMREKNNKTYSYSRVKGKLEELERIKKKAYKTRDELEALKEALDKSSSGNLEPALEMYKEAKEEFNSERYGKSLDLIGKTYDKISELEAAGTKLRAFYEATSRNIKYFFMRWWKHILAGVVIIGVILLLTYNRLSKYLIKTKITYLKGRRKSIKQLIGKTQKKYFEDGTIPESTYRIRTKKYGDLIRDINRQIPVLEEQLQARRSKEKKKVKKEIKENIKKKLTSNWNIIKRLNKFSKKIGKLVKG